MKTSVLRCQNCGAGLPIPDRVRFVTCEYCQTPLEVHRSEGAAWTEVAQRLANLEQRADRMVQNLEVVKLQNEVERLDREWEQTRRSYVRRHNDGTEYIPGQAGAGILMYLGVAAFGVFWTVTASSMGAPDFMPLFGVAFVVFALVAGVRDTATGQQYAEAQRRYQAERARLLAEIARLSC